MDLFAPLESSVEAVKSWLDEAGVASHAISQSANKQVSKFRYSTRLKLGVENGIPYSIIVGGRRRQA